MTDDDDARLDAALRQHWQQSNEPADAGFSLRVMAGLPDPAMSRRRRRARLVRRARWLAISLAACGSAGLLVGGPGAPDAAQALAAVALLGLLIFWTVPSRWNRA